MKYQFKIVWGNLIGYADLNEARPYVTVSAFVGELLHLRGADPLDIKITVEAKP